MPDPYGFDGPEPLVGINTNPWSTKEINKKKNWREMHINGVPLSSYRSGAEAKAGAAELARSIAFSKALRKGVAENAK